MSIFTVWTLKDLNADVICRLKRLYLKLSWRREIEKAEKDVRSRWTIHRG